MGQSDVHTGMHGRRQEQLQCCRSSYTTLRLSGSDPQSGSGESVSVLDPGGQVNGVWIQAQRQEGAVMGVYFHSLGYCPTAFHSVTTS